MVFCAFNQYFFAYLNLGVGVGLGVWGQEIKHNFEGKCGFHLAGTTASQICNDRCHNNMVQTICLK
jgi:hypothetical protein